MKLDSTIAAAQSQSATPNISLAIATVDGNVAADSGVEDFDFHSIIPAIVESE